MNAAPIVRAYDTAVSQQSSGQSSRTIQTQSSCESLMDERVSTSRKRKTFKNDKVELLQATIDYLNENKSTKVASQAETGIQHVQDNVSMYAKCPEVSKEQTDTVSRTDGFRACMKETIRYLIENEGFPPEHPVILRLRTHLQQRLELCGQESCVSSQITDHSVWSSRTIPTIPQGSPAIPTGVVDTSANTLSKIMKPLTIDTRYQYAIPESISQHLTQESQNSNGALNRCLLSNNSLLAVVPENTSFMNNNVQCNLQASQPPSTIYQQQMHASNCATLTNAGFNLNYVAPYVMAWVRPQQPNMST
ncbi:uncharacterized protein LOC117112754 isoform X2 [Anneissia japonica]|uniref:uncharacterized protein LOC117112754 isoform X2 n=1 Tax=Anneissia japonica TaxID=1529436 RepID=UPI0014257DE7|nr:uncharacterized protein LOC117112754 isoform X2 [Anneissia japonica]